MVQINISHSFYRGLRIAPGGTNGHFTLYIAPVSYPSFIESEILFSVKWIHTRFFFFFFLNIRPLPGESSSISYIIPPSERKKDIKSKQYRKFFLKCFLLNLSTPLLHRSLSTIVVKSIKMKPRLDS